MFRKALIHSSIALGVLTLTAPEALFAQSSQRFRERLKEKVQRRVEDAVANAVARKAAEGVDSAAEKVVDGVRGGNDDEPGAASEAPSGADSPGVDRPGNDSTGRAQTGSVVGTPSPASTRSSAPSPKTTRRADGVAGAWDRYDFVPGDRVLFHEDFSADRIGNFPLRLELVSGAMQVVEWQGRHLLEIAGRDSLFAVKLPETLPERFTLEFELFNPTSFHGLSVTTAEPLSRSTWAHYYEDSYFSFGHRQGSGVRTKEGHGPTSVTDDPRPSEAMTVVRVMADGSYVKVYVGENRVANVPNARFERGERLYFHADNSSPEKPSYVADIRIAAGNTSIYEQLEENGSVALRGILFESGSAVIRPESTPQLREIGDVLRQHRDLTLRIEGHTDNTGDTATNQTLSEERAVAVRAALIDRYGVDGARLTVQGFGESQPVDTNETPEGRQNNRRVELVRLSAAEEIAS